MTVEVTDYQKSIEEQRTEKDLYMSNDFNSPFLTTNTPFHRLDYFEIDKSYVIEATFIRNNITDSITLITNTGENQVYYIYGNAVFEVDGKNCLVQLLKAPESEKLFLPFMDKTSGESTYGAGRYLDLEIPRKDEITIDFNLAYNPYCAYTPAYSCPFPPKENVLGVAIEAGEKTFSKSSE